MKSIDQACYIWQRECDFLVDNIEEIKHLLVEHWQNSNKTFERKCATATFLFPCFAGSAEAFSWMRLEKGNHR